jgi:hypothetical protein
MQLWHSKMPWLLVARLSGFWIYAIELRFKRTGFDCTLGDMAYRGRCGILRGVLEAGNS